MAHDQTFKSAAQCTNISDRQSVAIGLDDKRQSYRNPTERHQRMDLEMFLLVLAKKIGQVEETSRQRSGERLNELDGFLASEHFPYFFQSIAFP
ncbi:hypothetical protein D3C84_1094650 [compost metagenome]